LDIRGEKESCASPTMNNKGGTDHCVMYQGISFNIERLYPDASDQPGKHMLVKIDGGPGRLDVH
jgi:hypothetical protein